MSKNLANLCIKGGVLVLVTLGLLVESCKKTSPPSVVNTVGQQDTQTANTTTIDKTTNQPKLVPLNIKLPNARQIGTRQDVKVANMEKVTNELRPPFYAPEGTTNIALGKPVTSNQEPIIGELSLVTDGDKEAADGSFLEFGPGLNRITIDLGAEYNIYAIVVWHYHQQQQAYFDVIVQTADDPDFVNNVSTLFNNDIDNSAGQGIGTDKHYVDTHEGRLIDAKGTRARYVRLYSNGNSSNEQNHYTEVEVYGKAAE